MRHLKFRAWDNKYKVMLCTGFNIVGEVTLFNGVEVMLDEQSKLHNDTTPSLERLNDVIITQFIDREDSEGVDMYDGDILRSNGFKYLIIWDNRTSSFMAKSMSNNSLWTMDSVNISGALIIGHNFC